MSLKGVKFSCPVDFLTLVTHWQELRDRNLSQKKVQNNRKELYLADLDFDNPAHPDHVALLINITDTTIANRVIRDIHSNERFSEDRPDSQGVDYSSHVLISKTPDSEGKHLMLFERNAGFSVSDAMKFLNYLCQESKKLHPALYRVTHPANMVDHKNQPVTVNLNPKISVQGLVSDDFLQELASGSLNDIELVSEHVSSRGIDNDAPPEFRTLIMKISTEPTDGRSIAEYFQHLLNLGQQQALEKLKIRFKDHTGANNTAQFDTTTHQLLNESRYVKKRKITFESNLHTSYDIIFEPIRNKMLEMA